MPKTAEGNTLQLLREKNPEQFEEFKGFWNPWAPWNSIYGVTCIPTVIFHWPNQGFCQVIFGIPQHPHTMSTSANNVSSREYVF